MSESELLIRILHTVDLPPVLTYLIPHIEQSGRDGEIIYAPYSTEHDFEQAAFRQRLATTWARPLTEPGWKRGWGAFDEGRVVGHAMLHGGRLAAEMHRATLGMGVDRDFRRRGIATQLLRAAIDWARDDPRLAWVDLGVFSDNDPARTLYEKLGFRQVGVMRDRFRVDGRSIDDIRMTLKVG